MTTSQGKIIIIGAGPAGLGCAHALSKAKVPCFVIDKEPAVGGLCRTVDFYGYLFDIGGHRFLTKSAEVQQLWRDTLRHDLLCVKRLSRIYYRKKYFNYPLSFANAFWNLGLLESILCLLSYLKQRFSIHRPKVTFDGWVMNRFGKRLYSIFFKNYTEKLWGIACAHISADWAAQRIRGISLGAAIQKMIFGQIRSGGKALHDEFFYPKNGSGEFYERLKEHSSVMGSDFALERNVTRIFHDGHKIMSLRVADKQGNEEEIAVRHLFTTMPLVRLVESLRPSVPEEVLAAAKKLRFRSVVIVNLIFEKKHIFPDQWIYINSSEVSFCRIQNYKNWSHAMVADIKRTTLSVEYFCFEGDELWYMDEIDLINRTLLELEKIGIVHRKHYINGFVMRWASAYPIYSLDYRTHVSTVKQYLTRFSNLSTFGRAGLFRYDNADNALLAGIYAARNFLGEESVDLWKLDTDETYLEA